MQFLFILIVNVALWALFYLVISLKLERSASEFREKRLRREMDAIIKDFNETAERNISLLENRITVMKRLMQQSGVVKNLDLSVNDREISSEADGVRPEIPGDLPVPEDRIRTVPVALPGARVSAAGESLSGDITRLARGASNVLRMMAGKGALFLLERLAKKDEGTATVPPNGPYADDPGAGMMKPSPIQKDFSGLRVAPVPEIARNGDELSEDAIAGLFDQSDDKYALISDLHGQGCPIELISRCSGIPAGEIRLVLNLHGKQ